MDFQLPFAPAGAHAGYLNLEETCLVTSKELINKNPAKISIFPEECELKQEDKIINTSFIHEI